MKQIVTVTDKAARKMAQIMESSEGQGKAGIRLSIPEKGCSGLSYKFDFVAEPITGDEHVALQQGVDLYIDPLATMYILGTEIDYDDSDILAPGFKFNNPLATGSCGCGESFTIQE